MSDSSSDLVNVRGEIDAIDEKIIDLIGQRQAWVIEAGKLKKNEEGVRAPDRVEQVIGKVRRLASEAGASPDVVEKTYRAMISAFIELELGVHRETSS